MPLCAKKVAFDPYQPYGASGCRVLFSEFIRPHGIFAIQELFLRLDL